MTILKWFELFCKKVRIKLFKFRFALQSMYNPFNYNPFGLGLGFSTGMMLLFSLLIIWDLVWKLLAMWKASKKNSGVWFVVLAVVNTFGILPILYIYVFSEWKKKNFKRKR